MASNLDLEILDTYTAAPKTSKATTSRRKGKKQPKGGKASHSTVFTLKRYEFLGEYLETFAELHDCSRASQKKFWDGLFAEYWERFPWFLPFNKDPEADEVLAEPDGPDSEQTLAEKGKIIEQTQDRI
ncbi:hypothetical protein LXA43DRAFT_1101180 [Ganoderma leucocontextum]|nr:hypothetical protein LXA43DRAFT_1101180 [Ganoderma leucocontextum]